jgi:hypothetical protein
MKSLFRSFERTGVDYLLISGQASVLYGAATFSEDVDIWVSPAARNLRRLLASLAARGARIHKLTPPLTLRNAQAGHGFHFVVPGRPLPVYLDVLARPPRVGTFTDARTRARRLPTDWGVLPVVGIEDLVALKKTRRLADYDVITNLAGVRRAEAGDAPSRKLLRWAARNCFRAEERVALLRELGERRSARACRTAIAREIAALQAADIRYWKRIIDELRVMRRSGALWPDGTPVATLVGRQAQRQLRRGSSA